LPPDKIFWKNKMINIGEKTGKVASNVATLLHYIFH
jgi:hypothetical protein